MACPRRTLIYILHLLVFESRAAIKVLFKETSVWRRTMFLLSPQCHGLWVMLQITPISSFFSTILYPFQVLLSLTSLNADVYCSAPCWCKKLEVERDTRCHLSPGLTPTKQAIALVSSGLAGLQHRGGFGGLGAPHLSAAVLARSYSLED